MSLITPYINSISGGSSSLSVEVDVNVSSAISTNQWSSGASITAKMTRWGRVTQLYVVVGGITDLPLGVRLVDFDNHSAFYSKIVPAAYPCYVPVDINGSLTTSYDFTIDKIPLAQIVDSGIFIQDINAEFTTSGGVTIFGTYINSYDGAD